VSDYIPTTADIRDAYSSESSDSTYANRMFDFWLAKYKAKVIAKTEERIIKLLEACPNDEQWHLDNLMCCEGRCDFAIQDYQDRLIALIKGENK